jgi:hypothetical protein
MVGIGVCVALPTPSLPLSNIAMIRIGLRLIYKISWIGLDRSSQNHRPFMGAQGGKHGLDNPDPR